MWVLAAPRSRCPDDTASVGSEPRPTECGASPPSELHDLSWYIELVCNALKTASNRENAMNGSRRQLLTRGLAAAAAISTSSSAIAQLPWNRRGQAPTEADYFHGTAFDHGVEYRATNMALIPKEFRPRITSEIIDPEPGRLVIDTREHFLYLTRADGTAIRYAVGVGREGFQWFGSAKVSAREYGQRGHRPRKWSSAILT